MGKKDKSNDQAKIAAKKARIAAKQQKATLKRAKKEIKDQGEDDIESILAEYQQKDKARTAVTITPCSQPSPRSNFSLTALPNNEMLMFGGEFCDGESTVVYNELYRWNIEKGEWKQIESLNTPSPRCSHQAVFFKDHLYIFGGEYATLDQFHHYRDMWALNLKTNVWREVPCKGEAPSARSGHRMVVWRNFIVLFGGFYEALKEVRWFGDLYIFSLQDERWIQVPERMYAPAPKPRSGFLMTIHPAEDAIFVYGGYSKEKNASRKSEGKIHNDMWMLSLRGVVASGGGVQRLDTSKATWQKISNKGNAPTPRCGASMITYKNKGIYFGGVYDREGPRHTIESMFYNDLYAFDFERKRWYELGLKKPRVDGGKKKRRDKKKGMVEEREEGEISEEEDDSGSSDDEDEVDQDENDLANTGNFFGYIDDSGNVVYVNIDEDFGEDDGMDGVEHKDMEVRNEKEEDMSQAPERVRTESSADDDWVKVDEKAQLRSPNHGTPSDSSEIARNLEHLSLSAPCAMDSSTVLVHAPETSRDPDDTVGQADLSDVVLIHSKEDPIDEVQEYSNPLQRYFAEHSLAPVGRINPCLVMKGCTLHVYGGVTEIGDVEVTLDDCWSLDLNKRDCWRRVLEGSMSELVWKGEDDDQSEMTGEGSDSEEDSCSDGDSDEEEEQSRKEKKKSSKGGKSKHDRAAGGGSGMGIRAEMAELRSRLPMGGEDEQQIPLCVGKNAAMAATPAEGVESLREFYSRTSVYWKKQAVEMWSMGLVNMDGDLVTHTDESEDNSTPPCVEVTGSAQPISREPLSDKEIKRIAFSISQRRYEDVLPVIVQLAELEQSVGEEPMRRGKSRGRGDVVTTKASSGKKSKGS